MYNNHFRPSPANWNPLRRPEQNCPPTPRRMEALRPFFLLSCHQIPTYPHCGGQPFRMGLTPLPGIHTPVQSPPFEFGLDQVTLPMNRVQQNCQDVTSEERLQGDQDWHPACSRLRSGWLTLPWSELPYGEAQEQDTKGGTLRVASWETARDGPRPSVQPLTKLGILLTTL